MKFWESTYRAKQGFTSKRTQILENIFFFFYIHKIDSREKLFAAIKNIYARSLGLEKLNNKINSNGGREIIIREKYENK